MKVITAITIIIIILLVIVIFIIIGTVIMIIIIRYYYYQYCYLLYHCQIIQVNQCIRNICSQFFRKPFFKKNLNRLFQPFETLPKQLKINILHGCYLACFIISLFLRCFRVRLLKWNVYAHMSDAILIVWFLRFTC